ncbi:MAG: HypC/HybG/HupF family hydrogenase formation chaperone [Pseudomonadota bacterium]
MCLAVPAKVASIEGNTAIIDLDGVSRSASLMLVDDVAVGDYVIMHAGFAIHKLDPHEAKETLKLFEEIKSSCPPSPSIRET